MIRTRMIFLFTALDLCSVAWRGVLTLGWAAVNLVADTFSLMIADNGIFPFIGTQIPTVTIFYLFFAD